jgi:hypothetical protein
MKNSQKTLIFLIGLILIWIIPAIIINPLGNFPIGDDFAYGKPLKYFLETGKMTITNWSSMTLIGHLYIGSLVTSIFGFSFSVLRITTLFFGLLGVIAFFFLVKEFGVKNIYSAVAAFLLGFHPMFYYLNYTYMTDVSFLSISILSLLFYVKFIKLSTINYQLSTINYYILACIFNIIALLIRDLAIIFPVAFSLAYIYKYGFKIKNIFIIFLPLFLILITFFLWRYWVETAIGIPKNLDYSRKRLFSLWMSGKFSYLLLIYVKNIVITTMYFGLYTIPVILALFYSKYKDFTKKSLKFLCGLIIILNILFVALILKIEKIYNSVFEMLSSHVILHNFVFGNIHLPQYSYEEIFPKVYIIVLAVIGLTAGIVMCYLFYYKIKEYFIKNNNKIFTKWEGIYEFIFLNAIFYLILIFSQYMYNRYLFPLFILTLLLLLINENIYCSKSFLKVFFLGIVMLFYFYNSIAGAHDLMEYNRNVWFANDYLENELKINKANIDGGFEYNAYYFYNWNYKPTKDKNWWWINDDEYLVTFGKPVNYKVLKEFPWTKWIPPCNNFKIYALQKKKIN